jgi:YcxB-like protein
VANDQLVNPVVVQWSPEPADLRELLRSPGFRRRRVKSMVSPTAILAGGVAMSSLPALRLAGVAAASVGGTLLLVLIFGYSRAVNSRWRSDPLIREPVTYTFDVGGVLRQQADFECRWGWNRIRGVEETRRAFILRLSDGSASGGPGLLIAKRGLGGPAEASALRTMLAGRTPAVQPRP